ncbi:MAG TPA: NBR1-Ig-like domain-containing protein [Anaerolineales bacterium]|nr:NBR1-Ig-like domain-containing protein [Anaerolineales bacterium]
MSKSSLQIFILSMLFALVLSSCNLPSSAPQTEEPNAIFTQAALTVQAQLNQAPTSAPFNTPTLPPPQPTNTAITLPTLPPATNTPVASATPVCDQGQYIKDVTIPDGTTFAPGITFTKTWRLRNAGTCTWSGYSLVFDSGDAMSGTSPIAIGTVGPGQEVDLSVNLTAPATNGSYRGYWRIRTPSGVLIPILSGHQGQSFFVDIKVGVFSSGYDFYTRASSAIWISGAGTLTFGGLDTDDKGFAMYKDGQKLEDGTIAAKTIETHPQFVDDGVISGRYPVYTIVTGEHFTARIGFLAKADGTCGAGNAKFQLNYREGGGSLTPLGEWTKSCDGTLKSIDVDLTSLKGKAVEIILAVMANGSSSQDWAVWVKPQIAIP